MDNYQTAHAHAGQPFPAAENPQNPAIRSDPQGSTVIAGYRLLKALGSGTMGEVWKVADPRGNIYAAKILRSKLAIKP
ncbi:MAG: hypothetical protein E6165_04165, partial [Varibaculum cambriense]|nr:hypothetical protein [Varibaculum cambriense]